MGKVLVLLVALGWCSCATVAAAKMPYMGGDELKLEAQQGFAQILELWRDGKYAELYERSIASGSQSKEAFIKKLAASPRRPSCCWEQLQEVRVTVKDDSTVILRAKVGMELVGSASDFRTRPFKLVKEEGVWKAAMADLLSLAGETKKQSPARKKRSKGSKSAAAS